MKIELRTIKVRDLVDGYANNDEGGVVGYHGRLDIRPKYQREFVYKEAQRAAVIDTVRKGFPLNVMYWVKRADGGYEVLDGQQRTLSICQYVANEFFIDWDGAMLGYCNLTDDRRDLILDYGLTVYVCEGTDSEKLAWFRTINIAGERLTEQEIRNAVYAGPWTTDAKRYFSKTNGPAYGLAHDYLSGVCNRQDYLETAIRWISKGDIEGHMAKHQHDPNAAALWIYFQSVISWVKAVFPRYRRDMKGVAWGEFYDKYHANAYDAAELERRVKSLMEDSDVAKKSGIYAYVFDGDEHHLQLRAFDGNTRREVYERQKGVCAICGKRFAFEEMEADHITPWAEGGRTVAANCQMLCRTCNRRKSDK